MATSAAKIKVNILNHWGRAVGGGFLAFLVFNLLVTHVTPKFLNEPLDIALAMTVLDLDLTAADVVRFLVGCVVFPLVYLALFLPFVPLAPALRGLVFGGVLWLGVGLAITPLAGVGWFYGGVKTAWVALLTHLVYGVILGLMVGQPVLSQSVAGRGAFNEPIES